jgi:DNA-binding transcriptional MerR regulator
MSIKRQYYRLSHVALAANAPVNEVTYLLNKGVIDHDITTNKGTRLFVPSNVEKIINVIRLKRTNFYKLAGLKHYYETGDKKSLQLMTENMEAITAENKATRP